MSSAVFEFSDASRTADRRTGRRRMWSARAMRIAIGLAGGGVGILVYLVDRRPEHTYFLFRIGVTRHLYESASPVFGFLNQNLPGFLHVFAFSLITGGILACRKKGSLIVALSWFATDAAFEVGQRFPARAESLIPQWFDSLPVLESARVFFRAGTFDPLDLIAMAFGAVAAYGLLLVTVERRRS
jgi:hypothetical protein